MNKIVSKVIQIKADELPPQVDFIESEIIKAGIKPLRWAIVEVEDKNLTLSVSGEII